MTARERPDPAQPDGREYRHVESGMRTRDELVADDWHCAGMTVHYRDAGGPWKVYATGEYAP